MSATETANMINLLINGEPLSVPKGTTVYNAARQIEVDIPIFCYQDRMPPFGACRMCLVEVEGMAKLQTSCTLEVAQGMVVKTQSERAVKGREGILELLLINHPLDCPICDRGGECPLQEQAFKHGPGRSRFFEDKRHFTKAKPLGPVLMLDRERCIVCARCTRFSDELSGDHALEFIDRGYKTEVGTPDGGPAKSKFIGNTISICPVGALTSQVYRFRARPWDNESTNSTCTLCPMGCSLILDSRDGEIMRTRSREDRNVNDIWLCDKGWFGYEFTSHPDRLKTPLIRRNGDTLETASWDEAFSLIAEKITEYKSAGKLGALGGNPLTVEENYLWQQLMRQGAGVNNLDHRIGMPIFHQDDVGIAGGMESSIGEIEDISYAILCGSDLTEEMPVLWLRLKQAINRGAKVIFMGHYSPEIAPHLEQVIIHPPGGELEAIQQQLAFVSEQATAGKKGALFVGSQYLSNINRKAILANLLKLRQETANLSLNILEGSGNSLGASFAGMRPDAGAFGEKLTKPGLNVLQMLETAANSGWDLLYLAGVNPVTKYSKKLWDSARRNLGFLIVQDLFLTEAAQQADLVLPALSYVEKGGSFINIEGRIQKLQPGKETPANLYGDGDIFTLIGKKLGLELTLDSKFIESMNREKIALSRPNVIDGGTRYQLQPQEGQLLATFAPELFDHGVRMQHDPHLIQLSKEPRIRMHLSDALKLGLKNDSIVRLSLNGATLQGKVRLDSGVAKGTVVLPLGFPELPVHELDMNLLSGFLVEVSSVNVT